MFKQLHELACKAGPLAMTVSADAQAGRMTIVVVPKADPAKDEPALSMPLALTATPAEFDEGFVQALAGYSERRMTLAEQVAATNDVLAAAKEASAKKGAAAVSKAGARMVAKPVNQGNAGGEGDEDDTEESGEAGGDGATTKSIATPASASPNLFG